MSLVQVEFQYNGNTIVMQCQENQKLFDISKAFISKIGIIEKKIYFFIMEKYIISLIII